MLLLGELPLQDGVGHEYNVVFESIWLISHEVITVLLTYRHRVHFRLLLHHLWLLAHQLLMVCKGFWLRCFTLVLSYDLRLDFGLLIYDFLHNSYKDVDHHHFSVEVGFKLGEQDPLESEVEAFASEQLLEAHYVENGVCVLDCFCDG